MILAYFSLIFKLLDYFFSCPQDKRIYDLDISFSSIKVKDERQYDGVMPDTLTRGLPMPTYYRQFQIYPHQIKEVRNAFARHLVRCGFTESGALLVGQEISANIISHSSNGGEFGEGRFCFFRPASGFRQFSVFNYTSLTELSKPYKKVVKRVRPGTNIGVDFRFPRINPEIPGHHGMDLIAAYCDDANVELRQELGLDIERRPFVVVSLLHPHPNSLAPSVPRHSVLSMA